jgi:uncharacterized membrane protein
LAWWTLYTGILADVLMGLLFATEYAIRTVRRRRFAISRAAISAPARSGTESVTST